MYCRECMYGINTMYCIYQTYDVDYVDSIHHTCMYYVDYCVKYMQSNMYYTVYGIWYVRMVYSTLYRVDSL